MLIILVGTLTLKNSMELKRNFKPSWKALVLLLGIGFYALVNMNRVSEFLYFQF